MQVRGKDIAEEAWVPLHAGPGCCRELSSEAWTRAGQRGSQRYSHPVEVKERGGGEVEVDWSWLLFFFDAGVPLCVVRQNALYTTHRDKPGFPTSSRPCAPGTPQMDDSTQVSVCRLLLSTGVSVRNRIGKSGC